MLKKPPRRSLSAFPTTEESLALQASLLDGDRAIEAWKRLSATGNPLEGGVSWIAPLLMANLARLIPEDPWVRNNPHFLTLANLQGRAITESAQSTLHCLAEASVPTLALKGLALGATVYASPGLRTVSDFDILVPRTLVFGAMKALEARGLRSGSGGPRTPADLRANHAHVFYPHKAHQPSIDLHWHVLASARGDEDDEFFWSGSEPLAVGTAPTRALCPEDQLLHVLIHGVRWTRMPHVRWVADAVMVLRRSLPLFRVDRFLASVARFEAAVPVQEGLRFVFDLTGEGGDTLDRVEKLKTSRFAQKAFEARAAAYEDRTITERIALRFESALWSRRAQGPKRGP